MQFSKTLTHWYSVHKRSLPWRETQNPYRVWLSEIILQQTQVNQGLPYYERFLERFPTIQHLSKATEQEVLRQWQGLGYYSRARNLHATAKHIVANFDGDFPTTYRELIKLKGIGDYTASAIASICNDEPCAVVDGNVYRVLSRYFRIKTPINTTQGIKEFKSLAQSLLPTSNIGEYNQAIMEFGARQCKPRNPDCTVCPLSSKCLALKHREITTLPVKLKKTKVRTRYFNYLVFVSQGKTILEKRVSPKDIWQNLYQFPLVETQNEMTQNSFRTHTHVKEVLNASSTSITLFNNDSIVHKLSHQHLFTKFWIIENSQNIDQGIPVSEIERYPVPALIKNFIDKFDFKAL